MSNMVTEYVDNSHHKSSVFLLKVRIWFHSCVFLFLSTLCFILLRIDFSVSEDPAVRIYQKNRWLLITSWFNLLSLAYSPVCVYCDWRELNRSNNVKHVKILNEIRFVCFTTILFPATTFSDIFFWKLWIMNRELLIPSGVHALVSVWMQHCLHSVSLVVIVLDLLLLPRRRPRNLTFGASVLGVFLAIYCAVCARSITIEEYIYPLLKIFNGYEFILLVVLVSVEHFLFFTSQWFIIEYVWGPKTVTHKNQSSGSLIEELKKDSIREAKRLN